MSQKLRMEVMTPTAEKFSVPSVSDEEEEDSMVINRRKKKTKKRSSASKMKEGSSDDETIAEMKDADAKSDCKENKSPIRLKRKSRIMDFNDSSSDEDAGHTFGKAEHAVPEDESDSKNASSNVINNDSANCVPAEVPTQSNVKDLEGDSGSDNESEKSGDESTKSDDESAKSNDESADSSDDDAPPIRIFRSTNPSTVVGESRGLSIQGDDDIYDDEREEGATVPDLSEVAEPQPFRARKPKRPSMADLQSETQRLVRESPINLPYHRPEPKRLSEFMKRPTLKKDKPQDAKKDDMGVATEDVDAHLLDDLPVIGSSSVLPHKDAGTLCEENRESVPNDINENKGVVDGQLHSTSENPTDTSTNITPNRPLTRRERLLQRLGKNLPQLNAKKTEKSGEKFIDLDEDAAKQEQSAGVTSLMQRFMKHSTAGKRKSLTKKEKVEFSIVRKQERADGSGVELVSDVVMATVGDGDEEDEDGIRAVKNAETSGTPGQRLQLLRQRLAEKMKKRREIERKKREELHKLDNEEVDGAEDEEEEECDWSDADTDEEEAESAGEQPMKEDERRGNGLIDDSDESDQDTEPFEDQDGAKENSSMQTLNTDSSLPRLVNEGSVMLFEESTRSSASTTLNKSGITEGRVTPAFDHTCSDDSFYSSLIPLHQPEVSNLSAKQLPTKHGEFDDTCFEADSRSMSQPFKLDFEASQSQFLDADGYIRESSLGKGSSNKRNSTLLPLGAEDDNAMTDCNMSQLLGLCSAPFETQKTQKPGTTQQLFASKSDGDVSSTQELLGLCTGTFTDEKSQKTSITRLMDGNDSALSNTQELIGLCTGNFTDSVLEESKYSNTVNEKTTAPEKESNCDVTKEDDDSGDLFRNSQSAIVDESFGFNILPADPKNVQKQPFKFSDEENSDDENDEPVLIVRKKSTKRFKLAKEFLENEAELSGSDMGSEDEDEGGPGNDEYEIEEPVEELPQEEEIARQVNRVHRRQMLEEDQRDIELLQEAFMGGEEIAQRERKFRWKNMDSSLTQDMFKSDDEDSNHGDGDPTQPIEDTQWMKERLEREEFLRKNENAGAESEDSKFFSFGRRVVVTRQNSCGSALAEDTYSNSRNRGRIRNGRLSVDDSSSCSRDSFANKGRKGSFLARSEDVLAKLASLQKLKNVNGPRHSDKMLFKAVSPKSDKRKRKETSEMSVQSATKAPPRKKKKVVNINEDSNSVFDLF